MTNSTRQVEATNLVRELDAKAWQSHRIGAGKAKREQHVAYLGSTVHRVHPRL